MKTRIAACLCGGLTARVAGAPRDVYVCACRNCQKKSGSAFTYAAIFSAAEVSVAGAHKQYRYTGDSGRWIENNFCPTCGGFVFFTAQGFPDFIGINVGALDDQDFDSPGACSGRQAGTTGCRCRKARKRWRRSKSMVAEGDRVTHTCVGCRGSVSRTAIGQTTSSSNAAVAKKTSRLK